MKADPALACVASLPHRIKYGQPTALAASLPTAIATAAAHRTIATGAAGVSACTRIHAAML